MLSEGSASAGGLRWIVAGVPILGTASAMLPVYLMGAVGSDLVADTGLGPGGLGVAASLFFGAAGLGARPAAMLMRATSPKSAFSIAGALTISSMVVVGIAGSRVLVFVGLGVGGLGLALVQPAVNVNLWRSFGRRKLGLALGLKQASVPAATLIAGLAVPTLALHLGWRSVFLVLLVLPSALLLMTSKATISPSGPEIVVAAPPALRKRDGLSRLLMLGGALGMASSTCIGSFLILTLSHAGVPAGLAGILYAGCSALGLLNRVALGRLVDGDPARSPSGLLVILFLAGAVGYTLLATDSSGGLIVGAVLAFGAGWAWTGLFEYLVLRNSEAQAGELTGVMQTDLSLGAALGPVLFGTAVAFTSFTAAWLGTAFVAVSGALMVQHAKRLGADCFSLRNS